MVAGVGVAIATVGVAVANCGVEEGRFVAVGVAVAVAGSFELRSVRKLQTVVTPLCTLTETLELARLIVTFCAGEQLMAVNRQLPLGLWLKA